MRKRTKKITPATKKLGQLVGKQLGNQNELSCRVHGKKRGPVFAVLVVTISGSTSFSPEQKVWILTTIEAIRRQLSLVATVEHEGESRIECSLAAT